MTLFSQVKQWFQFHHMKIHAHKIKNLSIVYILSVPMWWAHVCEPFEIGHKNTGKPYCTHRFAQELSISVLWENLHYMFIKQPTVKDLRVLTLIDNIKSTVVSQSSNVLVAHITWKVLLSLSPAFLKNSFEKQKRGCGCEGGQNASYPSRIHSLVTKNK